MDNLNTSKITLGNYDDSGIENVVFTDTNSDNAKKVDLGEMNTSDDVLEETQTTESTETTETESNNSGNTLLFAGFFLLLLLFRKKS